jgi:hypothetical protein
MPLTPLCGACASRLTLERLAVTRSCSSSTSRTPGLYGKAPAGLPSHLVGGYYVVYEDGYDSFSPAAAFEAGYAALDGTDAAVDEAFTLAELGGACAAIGLPDSMCEQLSIALEDAR